MSGTTTLSIDRLDALVREIFHKAGMSAAHAGALARVIVAAERDGCKSHGIHRIDVCLRTLNAKKVDPVAEPAIHDTGRAVLQVSANDAFAYLGIERAIEPLARAARRFGLGALAINDCVHVTALWPEVEKLTDLGLVALVMCPSYATVAPSGGATPLLGTNPLAFGWPRAGNPPYVFDFATSVAARGEIELHSLSGTKLPDGWAVDAHGNPTDDPQAALDGAMLPFGGHKGSAIATMIELMAGALIGDLTSKGALDALGTTNLAPRHGELILAFSPEVFAAGRASDPMEIAETLFGAIAAQGARLPSQRRFAARARSEALGIELTAEEFAQLTRFRERGLDAVG